MLCLHFVGRDFSATGESWGLWSADGIFFFFFAFRLSIVQVGLFYAMLCPSAFSIVGGELGCYIRRGLWLFGMNDFARTG